MEMDLVAVEKHLRQRRAGIDELSVPGAPGVYACFLTDGDGLRPFVAGADGLIYVGVTSNLADREIETHFNSDGTRFSTLRRSLGAILKTQLGMTAIPRSPGASETNVSCYRFIESGEHRLTEWMRQNIQVGVCSVGVVPELESALIARMRPLLNLKGWPNPDRKEIKRLRKLCADEARAKR